MKEQIINKIINLRTSALVFKLMFFSTWIIILFSRLIPERYYGNALFRAGYCSISVLLAILAANYFFIYLSDRKFRSWLSIICFYTCLRNIIYL